MFEEVKASPADSVIMYFKSDFTDIFRRIIKIPSISKSGNKLSMLGSRITDYLVNWPTFHV